VRGRLVAAGIIAFAVILGSCLAYLAVHPYHWTLDPVDLGVYRSGGLIVRHVRPWYDPHLAAPLYDWPGYQNLHLKFTYPPFAAVVFAVVSLIPWRALPRSAWRSTSRRCSPRSGSRSAGSATAVA
jgi:hypothetical protein